MGGNTISIFQDMTPHAKKPFRLVEKFPSLDGYRTRMSSHCFDTYEEAHAAVMDMEKPGGIYYGD